MMMTGVDPYRDSVSSDFSDCSDIVGTPGAIPFTWEEQPGRPKGPAEKLFESIILSRNASRRDVDDSMIRESITTSQRAPASEIVEHTTASDVGSNSDTSSSDDDNDEADSGRGLSSRVMNLNLRASLMGVHILDDETEMFFSRQVSNASSNTLNSSSNLAVPTYRSGGAIPFKWELEPGIPLEGVKAWASEPRMQAPLTPPPGSRPVSGILYPYPGQFGSRPVSGTLFSGQFSIGPGSSAGALYSGQLDLGPDVVPHHENLSEKLFKKLVGQSRATVTTTPAATTPTAESAGHVSMFMSKSRRLEKSSTETLDRQFGHYNSDFCYEESVSPTSTLDHQDVYSESSVSSDSERLYPSRHRTLTAFLNGESDSPLAAGRRPSPCLLSLTAVATVDEITTDEDDIIFEQPNTAAPLLLEQAPISPHLHNDWPIVQYSTTTSTRPGHRHPKSTNSDPTRTFERWSSSSSSWNLSLGASSKGPKLILCPTGAVVGGKNQRGKPERRVSGASNGSPPNLVRDQFTAGPAITSTVLTYDRSGDTNGKHKWEIRGDSSGSLRSADELGFEPYDRLEDQAADTVLDEEDFPFSPIASSFVFGERNSVEVSKRSAGRGIPKAVGPIVQQFTSTPSPQFDHIHEYPSDSGHSEGGGSCSDERSLTYSLEGGTLQLEQEWIPTKSFHYIKGQGVEIVELGCSSRVFSGYIEISHSGRFDIDLETGPGIQRQSARTPEVLIRLVKDATKLGHKKKSGSKYGCFSQCKCLSIPKKGFLSRCLTSSNERPRLAVPNSFQSRLGTHNLASVDEKTPTEDMIEVDMRDHSPNLVA